MQIHQAGNQSIHLYLLESDTHLLLIDTGFPNTLFELGRAMRNTGYKIKDIDYFIVTHFHIDHAGAVQSLKNEGIPFVLFDIQQNDIQSMELMAKEKWVYTPIQLNDNVIMRTENSRQFLKQLNIDGQIIATPGHSDDSISLLLDSGEVFTGDLMAEHVMMDDTSLEKKSWEKLKALGAKKVFPSHGMAYEMGL
jgi:endoribonuclease LACTB2